LHFHSCGFPRGRWPRVASAQAAR